MAEFLGQITVVNSVEILLLESFMIHYVVDLSNDTLVSCPCLILKFIQNQDGFCCRRWNIFYVNQGLFTFKRVVFSQGFFNFARLSVSSYYFGKRMIKIFIGVRFNLKCKSARGNLSLCGLSEHYLVTVLCDSRSLNTKRYFT